MNHRITLKQKLIIYFAGVLVVALAIQAFFNYRNSSRLLTEQIEDSSNKSLKNMQEERSLPLAAYSPIITGIPLSTKFVFILPISVSICLTSVFVPHVCFMSQVQKSHGV